MHARAGCSLSLSLFLFVYLTPGLELDAIRDEGNTLQADTNSNR
jgi:hypothetical protein